MCDVIVLEDEPAVRELLVEILAEAGFAVHGAGTADAALSVLFEHGPRLLVADKLLSGQEDGFALARHALRLRPGLRVIYTSGHPQALDDFCPGPDERVLPKPFRASELVGIARELIGPPRRVPAGHRSPRALDAGDGYARTQPRGGSRADGQPVTAGGEGPPAMLP